MRNQTIDSLAEGGLSALLIVLYFVYSKTNYSDIHDDLVCLVCLKWVNRSHGT